MPISSSLLPEPDEFDSLRLLGFETTVIRALKAHAGERFLPVQRKALEAGLFEGRNLVVMGPTASGKGLVGELACLREAQASRRSIFLVSSRALATEKHRHFLETYGPLGIRAVVSSSDHRRFDAALLCGDFHLAVIVYEKLRSLLVRRPDLLTEIGVLVVDELQNLFDQERGPGLEFLLATVRRLPVQIIGLSAVLGNREVVDWLGADLVVETRRPINLRQGVLWNGIFRYREFNSQEEGEEAFVGVSDTGGQAVLIRTALFQAEEWTESVLVFVSTREESFALAAMFAESASLPAARGALAELDRLEPTVTVDFLRRTLARGVAVHNRDLTTGERGVVERAVRDGEVRLVCATTTLSQGVNLPVTNTYVPRRVYRGPPRPYEGYGRGPDPVPLLRCEFQNMTGRSGRPGVAQEIPFGRGILMATSAADAAGLFRHYVDGLAESLPPCDFTAGVDSSVLELLAREGPASEDTVTSFFAGSLSGVARPRNQTRDAVRAALDRLQRAALVSAKDRKLEAAPSGRLISLHGLRTDTAGLFTAFLRQVDPGRATDLDFLLVACLAPDGDLVRVPISRPDWKQGLLEREFLRLVDAGDIGPWVAGRMGYPPGGDAGGLDYDSAVALKKGILLHGYAEGRPTVELEERFQLRLGLIQRAAECAAWLLRALADLAHFHGWPPKDHERIADLGESVGLGLPKSARALANLLHHGLARTHLLALAAAGLETPGKVLSASEATLASVLPTPIRPVMLDLRRAVGEDSEANERAAPALAECQEKELVVDPSRPDRLLYRGTEVPLTRIQFRLMDLLYRNRGRCVSYDEIMRSVWQGVVVEQNNVIDQKGRILRKIESVAGKMTRPLIRTVRGQGLILE